ncbi:hypothetical protein E4T39_03158 [Aureobasidium subglaciale]|nr:hypothetical protein E4T39_03158 [Aureobasidium subglaciale]
MVARYIPPYLRSTPNSSPANIGATHQASIPGHHDISTIHVSRDSNRRIPSHYSPCDFELEAQSYTRHLRRLAKVTPQRDTPIVMRSMVVDPVTPSTPLTGTSSHAGFVVPMSANPYQTLGRPRRFWEPETPYGCECRMGVMLPTVSSVNYGLRPQARSFVPPVPKLPMVIGSPQKPRSLSYTPASRPYPAAKAPALLSLADIAMLFGLKGKGVKHTLNASGDQPGKLKFVLLNKSASRNWSRHQVIHAKTNLHLLPGYDLPYPDAEDEDLALEYDSSYSITDLIDFRDRTVSRASMRVEVSSASSAASTPPSSIGSEKGSSGETTTEANDFPPISLFAKVESLGPKRAFKFLGTFELAEIEFFAPNTVELMEMLDERADNMTWGKGLNTEWAKIKLVKSGSL